MLLQLAAFELASIASRFVARTFKTSIFDSTHYLQLFVRMLKKGYELLMH